MSRGLFITIEGIEGAGKSTQISYISSYFQDLGKTVCVTREPGGTKLGENIRTLIKQPEESNISPITELLLVFASRAEHLHQVIRPALQNDEVVICDRFTDSTYAYQGGGRGIDRNKIELLEFLVQDELRPDLTLIFDLSPELGLERAGKRSMLDRFEQENIAFFERVRKEYLNISKVYSNIDNKVFNGAPGTLFSKTFNQSNKRRYEIIDASKTISQVEKQIQCILESLTNRHA